MRLAISGLQGPTSPFDRIRARLTRGLQVYPSKVELIRGESLDVAVTVDDSRKLGDIEVGLVCTERYTVTHIDDDGPSESTAWATAFEAWQPIEPTAGEHTVRLTVPTDGPFSYHGAFLSFTWEVVARGVRRHRMDARSACEIEVRP